MAKIFGTIEREGRTESILFVGRYYSVVTNSRQGGSGKFAVLHTGSSLTATTRKNVTQARLTARKMDELMPSDKAEDACQLFYRLPAELQDKLAPNSHRNH